MDRQVNLLLSFSFRRISTDPGLENRYDILNLLDELPTVIPISPTRSDGFSDLPSDGEEMFYFEQNVREEIEREKKKKRLESARIERMRLIEEREDVAVLSDQVSSSLTSSPSTSSRVSILLLLTTDVRHSSPSSSSHTLTDPPPQPTAIQLTLMTRLHATLLASPNPALLEIRILANHASDERFSFLRRGGRYRAIWEEMKSAKVEEKEVVGGGLGGLAGYGSSDSDEEDEAAEVVEEEAALESVQVEVESADVLAARLKSAKLARALAWSAARRADRESTSSTTK